MSKSKFVARRHANPLRVSARVVPVVVARILKAQPPDITADEKAALDAIVAAGDEVSAIRSLRERRGGAKVRAPHAALVGAWLGTSGIIDGRACVPGPGGDEARALAGELLPKGITFGKADADTVWVESKRLLDGVEHQGLRPRFDRVVGADMFEHLRQTTDALGEAIGVSGDAELPPTGTAIAEALTRFGRAVAVYSRRLLAALDERDPASMRRFLAAVQPIDECRVSTRARSAATEEVSSSEGAPAITASSPAPPVVPSRLHAA